MGRAKVILLIEGKQRDEVLVLSALQKCKIVNDVVVARDGARAHEYLFGRYETELPQVVMLDPKQLDGLGFLRKLRTDQRTRQLPIVVFTTSSEEEAELGAHKLEPISFVRKPVEVEQFFEATRRLGLSQQVEGASGE
ncbi:MAG: hypothetical protein QOJ64_1157 [Acidobacteriota bacterium]|jgi:two-component system response regulator|nr:hypothetical protein [Acidobacteriota bacterium]